MEHLETELRVGFHLPLIERDDVVVADSEARSVEVELGFLFRSDADAEVHLFSVGDVLQGGVKGMELVFVVEDGDDILESLVVEVDDVFDVDVFLESVTNDHFLLVNQPLGVEFLDEVDVESRGGFEVDVVLEGFFEHEGEVARLGAVAVVVGAPVVGLCDGDVEETFGALYLRAYLGEVGDFERCSILFDDFHQRNVMEIEFAVLGAEFVLREVESLVN